MRLPRFYIPILLFIIGCNKGEQIPAYINVPDISFTTASGEGSASEDIVDIWVRAERVNASPQGVYELPVEFPILGSGNTAIIINAGVVEATSSIRIQYPFYSTHTVTLDLQATETDTVRPQFTYGNNFNFILIEDFETQPEQFTNVESIIGAGDPNVFEGTVSARVRTDLDSVLAAVTTTASFPFPANARDIFLEMNYKANHRFLAGMEGSNAHDSESRFRQGFVPPSENWQKAYINLSDEMRYFKSTLDTGSYKIVLGVVFESGTDPGSVDIFFDNIKLLQAK